MSTRLRSFTKAVYGFDAVVRRVDPDRWDDPSPCPDWTAHHVVGHQVDIMTLVAAAARGDSSGSRAADLGRDPLGAWSATRDDLFEALDHQGSLQREADTPFGHMTIDRFIGMLFVDPLSHTWDLARATGQDPHLDEDLAARGLSQLERAGELIRGPGMYAAAVDSAAEAPIADRFIAITGRDPAWTSPAR